MPLFENINCTNISCSVFSQTYYTLTSVSCGIMLSFSAIGLIFNSISVNIFLATKNMDTRFFQYLKIFSTDSLLINLNDFIFYLLFFVVNSNVFVSGPNLLYPNKYYIYYYSYVYVAVWCHVYTFGGLISIFFVYERLQLYNPGLKFLSKLSPKVVSIIMIILSIIINLPINLSRNTKEYG